MTEQQSDVFYNTFLVKCYGGTTHSVDLSTMMDNIEGIYVQSERDDYAPNTLADVCAEYGYSEDEFLDKWVRYIRDKNVPDNEGIGFICDFQNWSDIKSIKCFYDTSISDEDIKDMLKNIGYKV